MKEINMNSIKELSAALDKKTVSSVELTREYIKRIKARTDVNSFTAVCEESAIRQAEASDKRRAEGNTRGVLDGIPYALKDNICADGIATTCGSRILENFIPPYSATAAAKLQAAGCVLLGKTNMDEFAMGTRSDTSIFGAVKNPLDISRTAGGSSGGSAAAVAAKQVAFTLGSDTGGSARLPSCYCGGVAIKPTYGTVSRYGLVAFSPSLEQICPMTADVLSNAAVLRTIMGKDQRDATTLNREILDLGCIDGEISGLRIGIDHAVAEVCDESVKKVFFDTVGRLAELGANIISIDLPDTEKALAAYRIISCAEAFSNLARFDGIRYGKRTQNAGSVEELFVKSRSEGFGEQVKQRLLLGAFALGKEGRASYYKKAVTFRGLLTDELENIFSSCDVIMTPTALSAAPHIEKISEDGYREDRFCVIANLSGLPALTLPCGKDGSGMPIGLQLMSKKLSEITLYKTGYALEKSLGKESEYV